MHLDHSPILVLDNIGATHNIGIAQPNLTARCHAEEAFRRFPGKVILLDVDFTCEAYRPTAHFRLLRVIGGLKLIDLIYGIIVYDHLKRPQHRQNPWSPLIQILTNAFLKNRHIDPGIAPANADAVTEVANRLGWVSATTYAHQGRHTRVIPAVDNLLVDQLMQLALAHHRIGQVQSCKFILTWLARHRKIGKKPLIQRLMIFKLQGTDRMGDPFDGIRLTMGKVIHGIDPPGVAHMGMGGVDDAVQDRVAQIHIGRSHIDPGP